MTAQPVSQIGGRVRQVGKVFATFTVTNGADEIRAADGTISADQIRSLTLFEVLVDQVLPRSACQSISFGSSGSD